MNTYVLILLAVIYIFIAAIVMGIICKYESAGHEIGLLPLLSAFWPTIIVIIILYYPCKWGYKFGMNLFNFNKNTD